MAGSGPGSGRRALHRQHDQRRNKSFPDVAVGPDGRFAVAWRADQQDGDGWGVFARWFDSAGAALTGEVQVNTVAARLQRFWGIDSDGQSNFVIVWVDDDRGVIVRRFDGTGNPLSDELLVIQPTSPPMRPSRPTPAAASS